MKRIIEGVAYNTETSTAIAAKKSIEHDDFTGKSKSRRQGTLCLTRGGAFFIHESAADWGVDSWGEEAWINEEDRFLPMSRDEAETWITEGDVEVYSDLFVEVPEAAEEGKAEATIYIRVPEPLKRQIDALAKEAGQSVNAWATRCLERCTQETAG